MPSAEVVQKALVEIRKRYANYEYFFDHLSSPDWIPPLFDAGMFQKPLPPKRDGNYISFPIWPESRYLVRMAALEPQRVLDVLMKIPDTENVRVHEDMTDAALAMPVELAVKIVPKTKQWLESPYQLLLPQKLVELILRFARAGYVREAFDLAKSILTVIKVDSDVRARIADWDYEQILKKVIPDLMSTAGLETLRLLSDLLESAIKESRDKESTESTTVDYSYIWRPAIEDHEQNHQHELKGQLVSAIRDVADKLMGMDAANVLSSIEQRPFKIFQRIGLYLRSRWPGIDLQGTGKIISKSDLMEDYQIRHEFYKLLAACFGSVSEEARQAYLAFVDKGKDPKPWLERMEKDFGQQTTAEDGLRYVRHWQYEKLSPIQSFLDDKWKKRYEDFKQEFGDLDHPDFPSYVKSWWGGASPKSSKELSSMSLQDIVSFLKTWDSPGDETGISAEGLGRQLTDVVTADSKRFSDNALQFQDFDATYVRSFLQGIEAAAKQKSAVSWQPVLTLCEWVLGQKEQAAKPKSALVDRDPDWNWARKAVVNLLYEGLTGRDGYEIPFSLRDIVWSILRPLTDEPDISPEREESSSSFDPATRSINSTRGVAMHSVVKYALWIRRHIDKTTDSKTRIERGFDEMQEVREVLDYHLDPEIESTWTIRSVYGQWFPYLTLLDSLWAAKNVSKIFPREEKYRELRDVAWETYVVFCAPFDTTFEMLHNEYKRSIDQISVVTEKRKYLADPAERLAEHLMAFYWRGKIDLNMQGNLVDSLFKKAPVKIRRHALAFIGRNLGGKNLPSTAILDRLKTLWDRRLSAVRTSTPAAAEELVDFGWWFVSGTLDDSWSISQLKETLRLAGRVEPDHMVMKHLVDIANARPLDVVECLRMIIEGDKEGWRIHGWMDQAKLLLSMAINSSDEHAKEAAIDLIHRLGSRGHLQFRGLLG